jgi:DNA-binding NarL/FixJ family response regulator
MQAVTPARAALEVYLVEDSPEVVERLEALLHTVEGLSVTGHSGQVQIAVGEILARHPDAVVLDLRLGHGHGFEVLRAIRARAPDIAVYVLSNDTSTGYRDLARSLGARGYFDKSSEFNRVRDELAAQIASRVQDTHRKGAAP